jgi:tRNA1(Val) A37 N6-methylase TrmN6
MEYLPNGIQLEIPPEAFPLSTDSMVLAEFVKLPKSAKVLDIGSGCATLGLLLCASDNNCRVTGIEIQHSAHEAALRNIRRNNLEDRLCSIHADAKTSRELIASGSFDVCVSNPPYFSGGPASSLHANARRDDTLDAQALMECAAWALKTGGDFFLVHKPEKLAHLIALGAQYHLEAKVLRLIKHRQDGVSSLILLRFRKGAKPGLILEEASLHLADGTPSPYYRKIYHNEES